MFKRTSFIRRSLFIYTFSKSRLPGLKVAGFLHEGGKSNTDPGNIGWSCARPFWNSFWRGMAFVDDVSRTRYLLTALENGIDGETLGASLYELTGRVRTSFEAHHAPSCGIYEDKRQQCFLFFRSLRQHPFRQTGAAFLRQQLPGCRWAWYSLAPFGASTWKRHESNNPDWTHGSLLYDFKRTW